MLTYRAPSAATLANNRRRGSAGNALKLFASVLMT
jgi:hypothetical protein